MKEIFKEIKIIYEDENILAINKPIGLIVHSDGKIKQKTLVD
jgi:23S rRNA-/tRNA-specific pseudouridylate synthase